MKTIKFNFDTDNYIPSIKSFEELLRCMNHPHFDSAYIEYDTHIENSLYPLVLTANSTKQQIMVSGVTIGPIKTESGSMLVPLSSTATVELLRKAKFNMGQAITGAIHNELALKITIHND